MMTFVVVLFGWLFSLCLHEFSHALVAYYGGDITVREKGYLTFNLFKYTHPLYSLLFPLLILVMGGIGLPGGAVYIEKWRLRSRGWETAVSLAGPLSNLVVAVALSVVLRFAPTGATGIWPGLAFLALLQITAALFNLLPIPPFDGYGAISPFLSPDLRSLMDGIGQYSMWIILLMFWYVPVVSGAFWGAVGSVANAFGLPLQLANLGYSLFTFWR